MYVVFNICVLRVEYVRYVCIAYMAYVCIAYMVNKRCVVYMRCEWCVGCLCRLRAVRSYVAVCSIYYLRMCKRCVLCCVLYVFYTAVVYIICSVYLLCVVRIICVRVRVRALCAVCYVFMNHALYVCSEFVWVHSV